MDWMKLSSALFLILLLVILVPRAKEMLKNSPKGGTSDFISVLIPLALVMFFVFLLVKSL